MTRALIALAFLLLRAAAAAGEGPPAPPSVAAWSASGPIQLDGSLDEPAWAAAGAIPGLTQQDPEPGRPTPFDATRISVLTDGPVLYFGVVCPDPEPQKIAVHTLQRDADLEGDDTVALVLDTFGDGRTGYLFRINAGGARQDGLVSSPEEVSLDWDGLWEARTRRTASGWTAEIAVWARSLRFRAGRERWGFNVERTVARERLTLRWSGASLDARLADLQRAGELAGLAGLRQGLGLSFAPYVLGRAEDRRDRRQAPGDEQEAATGLDLSYNVTSGLDGVLTVNTDFAETEVDARQINLTRFPLFFPEKRSFFPEGSNLFVFSSGLETDFIPFYSRRVGLIEGEVVPIDAGLKLLGRAGPWAIAALDVETGDAAGAPSTNLFAGRATYDVDEHLRIGALATRGDPLAQGDNAFAGADGVWQASAFRGDKNLTLAAWGAHGTGGEHALGSAAGWGLRADYPNDLWDLSLSVNQYGETLDPALGFLPRPGIRQYALGAAYQPRPRLDGPFGWARQFFFELFPTRVDRLDGTTESWRVFTAPFNVSTQSGEHLEANWAPQFERLEKPFEVARGGGDPAGRLPLQPLPRRGAVRDLPALAGGLDRVVRRLLRRAADPVGGLSLLDLRAGQAAHRARRGERLRRAAPGGLHPAASCSGRRSTPSPPTSSSPPSPSTTPNRGTWGSTPACAGRSGPEATSPWSGTATGSASPSRATAWSGVPTKWWPSSGGRRSGERAASQRWPSGVAAACASRADLSPRASSRAGPVPQ
jgi:uncharacterized protein DUF5916